MHAGQFMILSRFILLMVLGLSRLTALTQSTTGDSPDLVYGNDPLLYNGRIYSFFPVAGTGGTQYISEKFDSQGIVVLRGVTYSNLNINYDIYNQQLILKYKDALGSTKIIVVSFAWLESFIMDGLPFEIINEADSSKRIYQVIGSGNKKILYFHQKELLLHNQQISGLYYFSKGTIEKYVLNENKMTKFKNNNSFISAFSPSEKELLKKYLRKQNINVKKANNQVLTDLINYCKTLGGQ